jgi:hypothetical protein
MNMTETPMFILTNDELQFFYLLHFAKKNTIWGQSIERVLQSPSQEKIKQLIKELKCQYNENPPVMVSILGGIACIQLQKL